MAYLLILLLPFPIFQGYISQPLGDECKGNEEHLECGPPCAVNCTNMNDPIFCTKPCYSGCFCKTDFVRDKKGNCIHPRDCYKDGCPENEEYVTCVNFCNACWESGECRTPYCIAGCDCKQGFYRNSDGRCVRDCFHYDFSYQTCGLNEMFSKCVNLCNDCVRLGRCDFEYYCEHGCDCKTGFFRNEKGNCVLENFCYQSIPTAPSIIEFRRGGIDATDLPKEETNFVSIHPTKGISTVPSINDLEGGKDATDLTKEGTNFVSIFPTKGIPIVPSITDLGEGGKDVTGVPKEGTEFETTHPTKGVSTVPSITELQGVGKDVTHVL